MAEQRTIVNNLRKDMYSMTITDVSRKYSEFKNEYPKMFEYLTSTPPDAIDNAMLEQMFCLKERMQNSNMDKFDSDVVIGEILGKQYVYSLQGIQEPSQSEKLRALDKLRYKNKLDQEKGK